MRSDAVNLLARLGRRDFRYREFTDNFADMELWPIFEALLTDERIVGKPISALAARSLDDIIPSAKAPAAAPPERNLFDRYKEEQSAPEKENSDELSAFLKRLSRNDTEGHD